MSSFRHGEGWCLSGSRQPAYSREPEVKSNLMMRKNFAGDLLPLIFTGKARCLSGGSQPADSRDTDVKTNLMMRKNFAHSENELLAKPRKAHSDTGEGG